MNNIEMYVIVAITPTKDEIEPLAVFSCPFMAEDTVQEMTLLNVQSGTIYTVLEMELDREPELLEEMKKVREWREAAITESIMQLMQEGLIDQLIGEDGEFYYTLTDLGKGHQSKIPKQIKKFFNKK